MLHSTNKTHSMEKTSSYTVLLYRSMLPHFNDLTSGELKLFLAVLEVLEWNTNTVFLNDHNKKTFAKRLNMTEESVRITMTGLNKKNFVHLIDKKLYRVNPKAAWYGEAAARKEILSGDWDWSIIKLPKRFK